MEKNNKGTKLFFIAAIILLTGISAFAATGSLTDVGTGAKNEIAGFIHSLKWIFSLAGVAVPITLMGIAWNKVQEKEEASSGAQGEPKFMKAFKVVGAGFAGLAIMYVVFGSLSVALLGGNFTDGWGIFVSDFWASALQGNSGQ